MAPLSATEREASDVSLGLDRPVIDSQPGASQGATLRGMEREVSPDHPDPVIESQPTYRQQRASQARQGAQLRESVSRSLALYRVFTKNCNSFKL